MYRAGRAERGRRRGDSRIRVARREIEPLSDSAALAYPSPLNGRVNPSIDARGHFILGNGAVLPMEVWGDGRAVSFATRQVMNLILPLLGVSWVVGGGCLHASTVECPSLSRGIWTHSTRLQGLQRSVSRIACPVILCIILVGLHNPAPCPGILGRGFHSRHSGEGISVSSFLFSLYIHTQISPLQTSTL